MTKAPPSNAGGFHDKIAASSRTFSTIGNRCIKLYSLFSPLQTDRRFRLVHDSQLHHGRVRAHTIVHQQPVLARIRAIASRNAQRDCLLIDENGVPPAIVQLLVVVVGPGGFHLGVRFVWNAEFNALVGADFQTKEVFGRYKEARFC